MKSPTSPRLVIHNFVEDPDALLESLRVDCAWPNPGSKRDKLDMTFADLERQNPKPWQVVHPKVRELMRVLDRRLGSTLNSCAVQRYGDGSVGCEWHADDHLDPEQPVVIVSLGAERVFETREIDDPKVVIRTQLPHGSAFVMPAWFQQAHEHRLPAVDETIGERISLVYARRLPWGGALAALDRARDRRP